MKFKVTEPTEEEANSEVMPAAFACDACRAVVYQLSSRLRLANLREPASLDKQERAVQSADLAEALEKGCDSNTYIDYGLKEHLGGGSKVLNGPGLGNDEPGTIRGGAKWPKRLAARCAALVDKAGEDSEVFGIWQRGELRDFCDVDCGLAEREVRLPKPQTGKKKRAKATGAAPRPKPRPARTGLEELPPPPHESRVVSKDNVTLFSDEQKMYRFALVLFHDVEPRSATAVAVLELAARLLKKEKRKDVRKTILARYNSTSGDTFGYPLKYLPRAMLYRKGYKNPKAYDGRMEGPEQVVEWLRAASDNYLKDDPAEFPRRGKGDKSDL